MVAALGGYSFKSEDRSCRGMKIRAARSVDPGRRLYGSATVWEIDGSERLRPNRIRNATVAANAG